MSEQDARVNSFLPSRAMLLRPRVGVSVDSSMLSNDPATVPIFSLLEKEEEVMREEGIRQWIKPREEMFQQGREKDSALQGLLNWARPMDERDADLTFEEYFQTLEDDEFEYDPSSGDWIFGEKRNKNDKDHPDTDSAPDPVANNDLIKRVLETDDPDEIETEDLEAVIRQFGNVDMLDLTQHPLLDPALRQHILNNQNPDDDDDPTVFV